MLSLNKSDTELVLKTLSLPREKVEVLLANAQLLNFSELVAPLLEDDPSYTSPRSSTLYTFTFKVGFKQTLTESGELEVEENQIVTFTAEIHPPHELAYIREQYGGVFNYFAKTKARLRVMQIDAERFKAVTITGHDPTGEPLPVLVIRPAGSSSI